MFNLDTFYRTAKDRGFLNTDGIRYDLNGKGMREYLESIGVKTLSNRDTGRNGLIECENGIVVSTNGYCYTK